MLNSGISVMTLGFYIGEVKSLKFLRQFESGTSTVVQTDQGRLRVTESRRDACSWLEIQTHHYYTDM